MVASSAPLEGEGGRRVVSRGAAGAVTGGWETVSAAVLAIANRLEGHGGWTEAVGAELPAILRKGGARTIPPSSVGLGARAAPATACSSSC